MGPLTRLQQLIQEAIAQAQAQQALLDAARAAAQTTQVTVQSAAQIVAQAAQAAPAQQTDQAVGQPAVTLGAQPPQGTQPRQGPRPAPTPQPALSDIGGLWIDAMDGTSPVRPLYVTDWKTNAAFPDGEENETASLAPSVQAMQTNEGGIWATIQRIMGNKGALETLFAGADEADEDEKRPPRPQISRAYQGLVEDTQSLLPPGWKLIPFVDSPAYKGHNWYMENRYDYTWACNPKDPRNKGTNYFNTLCYGERNRDPFWQDFDNYMRDPSYIYALDRDIHPTYPLSEYQAMENFNPSHPDKRYFTLGTRVDASANFAYLGLDANLEEHCTIAGGGLGFPWLPKMKCGWWLSLSRTVTSSLAGSNLNAGGVIGHLSFPSKPGATTFVYSAGGALTAVVSVEADVQRTLGGEWVMFLGTGVGAEGLPVPVNVYGNVGASIYLGKDLDYFLSGDPRVWNSIGHAANVILEEDIFPDNSE
jgi:hypothetical protein